MTDIIPVDFDKVAHEALKQAQFGFSIRPLSVNKYLVPAIAYTATGKPYPVMKLSYDAINFKNNLHKLLQLQKRKLNWERHPRHFGMWIILRDGLNVDTDNTHKMVQDVFVKEGIVPDDKRARDTRQMYGDFDTANVPKNFQFCVFIRWGKLL